MNNPLQKSVTTIHTRSTAPSPEDHYCNQSWIRHNRL